MANSRIRLFNDQFERFRIRRARQGLKIMGIRSPWTAVTKGERLSSRIHFGIFRPFRSHEDHHSELRDNLTLSS